MGIDVDNFQSRKHLIFNKNSLYISTFFVYMEEVLKE